MSATIPTTNANIVLSPGWGAGTLFTRSRIHSDGRNPQIDLAFTLDGTTDIDISLVSAANPIKVSVDGAAFTTPTIASNLAAWHTANLATGLAAGAHTLTIRSVTSADIYVDTAGAFIFTGGTPTMSMPSNLDVFYPTGKQYAVLNAAVTAFFTGEGSANNSTTLFTTASKNLNWTGNDFVGRFRGTGLKLWMYGNGEKILVRIDGVDQAVLSNTAASTEIDYVTVVTGLSDAFHALEIYNATINATTGIFVESIIPFGGSAPSLDLATVPATRKFLALYGDSLFSGGGGVTEISQQVALILSRSTSGNYAVANCAISGTLVSGALGNAGQNRTANITGMSPKPDVVWIMYGVNDIGTSVPVATFKTAYKAMLASLIAGLPAATKIVCSGLIPYSAFTWAQIQVFNAAIQQSITENGSTMLSYYDPAPLVLAGAAYNSGGAGVFGTNYLDGLHMSSAGAAIYAAGVKAALVASASAIRRLAGISAPGVKSIGHGLNN